MSSILDADQVDHGHARCVAGSAHHCTVTQSLPAHAVVCASALSAKNHDA